MNNPNKEAQYLHSQAIWEQQQHTQIKVQELLNYRQTLFLEAMRLVPSNEAVRETIARKLAEANAVSETLKKLIPSYVEK